MKAEELSGKDRTTAVTWQVLNIVGWSIVAVLGAAFLRWGFESAASVMGAGHGGDVRVGVTNYFGTMRILYLVAVGIGAPVVCGVFLGTVIGSRVAVGPVVVAAVLSLGMSAVIAYSFASYNRSQSYFYVVSAAAFLMLPVAVFTARWVSRRRLPRSLRLPTEAA